MKLGYDLYEVVSDDIISLLNSFKKNHLIVFQLTKIDDNTYRFYLPIYQRFLARKYNMQIIKSIGILYYLVVLFCKKINIIGVISFALTLLICSRFIFKVEKTGNSTSNNNVRWFNKTNFKKELKSHYPHEISACSYLPR